MFPADQIVRSISLNSTYFEFFVKEILSKHVEFWPVLALTIYYKYKKRPVTGSNIAPIHNFVLSLQNGKGSFILIDGKTFKVKGTYANHPEDIAQYGYVQICKIYQIYKIFFF